MMTPLCNNDYPFAMLIIHCMMMMTLVCDNDYPHYDDDYLAYCDDDPIYDNYPIYDEYPLFYDYLLYDD